MHFRSFSIKGSALLMMASAVTIPSMPTMVLAQSEDNQTLSIEDLEAFINLPASARLKKESDEDLNNPRNLFQNEALRREYIGDTPDYVYVPEGVDPMIIPWIRNQIVAGELLDDAMKAFERAQQTGDISAANNILETLSEITTKYPDAPQIAKSQELDTSIRVWVTEMTSPEVNPSGGLEDDDEAIPDQPRFPLPQWVRNNTTGVIMDTDDPERSVVLIGDFILKPGENLIDRYAGVRVKEIGPQRVIYEYNNREHVVLVESN